MSARNPTEEARNYWAVNDRINALAAELQPSRNGPVSADAFQKKFETIPGYNRYIKGTMVFQTWIADQRLAIQSKRPGVNPVFVSERPDATGMRMIPGLDLPAAVTYFRENLAEFGRILLA